MYELVGVNKVGEQLFFGVVDYEDFVIDTLSETELLECLDMFEIKGVTHSQNKLYCNPEVEGRHSFKADFLAGFRGASYWVLSGTKADGRSFADLYSSKGKVGKLSQNLGEVKKIRVQVLWMNMTTMCFLLTSEVDKDGQPVSEQQLSIKVNNSSKKNITVENNNSNNEDKSTAYLRFYYSGNDNYDADEQIVTLNFAKLDNEVKYTPSCTQTSHEYGEKVTFKYETGVDTKDITCYESDEDGKEIEDAKHLSIQKDGKDFIVKGTALSDSETPYYVTIKYAKNGVYKEASQTFEFGVHKINLHGDITVNENKLSVIFGKNKKMLITVTMESDFDNLTKDDVNKIDFALVASDDKEQIPLAATLKRRKLKGSKATYVYEVDRASAHMLASGIKYTITATANYAKLTAPVYFEPYSKIFDGIELKKEPLGINVQDTLTVKYNHDNNKLYYEITGEIDEYIEERPVSCKIKAADPTIIEIDDDGNFRTLKGGETTLTLTADDASE